MVFLLFDLCRVFGSFFFLLGVFLVCFFLGWVGDGFCVFCPAYPPLSAGAGLGDRATHLWHRTRLQSCGLGLGGSWRIPWYFSSRFRCSFFAFP